jgi:hypothetical protein
MIDTLPRRGDSFGDLTSCTFGLNSTFLLYYDGIIYIRREFEARCTTRRTDECITLMQKNEGNAIQDGCAFATNNPVFVEEI